MAYRNSFEAKCAASFGPGYKYEAVKLTYTVERRYTPDFLDEASHHIIETKGYFPVEDRSKMLAVKASNPGYRITLVFQNPNQTISKKSRTTYRQWALKNGFEVADAPR